MRFIHVTTGHCRSERPAAKGTAFECGCIFTAALRRFSLAVSHYLVKLPASEGGGAVVTPSTGCWAQCPSGETLSLLWADCVWGGLSLWRHCPAFPLPGCL